MAKNLKMGKNSNLKKFNYFINTFNYWFRMEEKSGLFGSYKTFGNLRIII
jgi:hypothetical protein